MFKPINSNKAANETGVIVSIGRLVRYENGERTMNFLAQLCPPMSSEYGARYNLYTPVVPRWEAPHEAESVDQRMIENHMVEAMHVLNCEVQFNMSLPR